jgi:hypothetical protein
LAAVSLRAITLIFLPAIISLRYKNIETILEGKGKFCRHRREKPVLFETLANDGRQGVDSFGEFDFL